MPSQITNSVFAVHTQQVHRVTHKILADLDEKKFCIGLYLDVEKAFDKVWLRGLLHKLNRILPESLYLLIKSYLTDRHFYVRVNDSCSSLRIIAAGIPQGSVLGPILYTLFTADIPQPSSNNEMIATFADDTVLLSSNANINTATTKLQLMVDNIILWFKTWRISINEQKTIQVIYTTRTKYTAQPIKIHGSPVQIEPVAKYLGMYIDSKLTWKYHLQKKRDQMKIKFRQLYWLLQKNSSLTLDNKLLIYNSVIKPVWTYGIQIWGTAKKTNIALIQRQQSKILRKITNSDWFITNQQIHRDLHVSTINEEIAIWSRRHHATLNHHFNPTVNQLPAQELTRRRRLKRLRPVDLL